MAKKKVVRKKVSPQLKVVDGGPDSTPVLLAASIIYGNVKAAQCGWYPTSRTPEKQLMTEAIEDAYKIKEIIDA